MEMLLFAIACILNSWTEFVDTFSFQLGAHTRYRITTRFLAFTLKANDSHT